MNKNQIIDLMPLEIDHDELLNEVMLHPTLVKLTNSNSKDVSFAVMISKEIVDVLELQNRSLSDYHAHKDDLEAHNKLYNATILMGMFIATSGLTLISVFGAINWSTAFLALLTVLSALLLVLWPIKARKTKQQSCLKEMCKASQSYHECAACIEQYHLLADYRQYLRPESIKDLKLGNLMFPYKKPVIH